MGLEWISIFCKITMKVMGLVLDSVTFAHMKWAGRFTAIWRLMDYSIPEYLYGSATFNLMWKSPRIRINIGDLGLRFNSMLSFFEANRGLKCG